MFGGQGRGRAPAGHDQIDLESNQLGCKGWKSLDLPLGVSIFDHEVASLDVAEITQPLAEGLVQMEIRGLVERKKADSRELGRLLSIHDARHRQPNRDPAQEPAPGHHWLDQALDGLPAHWSVL